MRSYASAGGIVALAAILACGDFGSDSDDPTSPPPSDGDAGPITGTPADRSLAIELAQKRASVAQRASTDVAITIKRGANLACIPTIEVKSVPNGVVASTPTIALEASTGTIKIAATDATAQGAYDTTVDVTCSGERASTQLGIDVRGYPGAIDPTFADKGTLMYPPTATGDYFVSTMLVTSNLGIRLHAGGTITAFDGKGEVDKSFGANGIANAYSAEQIALQGDSIVLVEGTLTVRRLAPNGAFDASFGGADGAKLYPPSADVNASERRIAVGPNKEVYASVHRSLDGTVTIAKLTANGQHVTAWGTNGFVTDQWAPYVRARGLAVRANGNVIATGHHGFETTAGYGFLALDATTGAPDTAFAGGKAAFASQGLGHTLVPATLPSGAIVLPLQAQIVKIGPNGALDATFASGGVTNACCAVAVEPDGRILYAGQSKIGRLLPDGKPDPSFGTAGVEPTLSGANFVSLYGADRFVVVYYKTSRQVLVTRYWR